MNNWVWYKWNAPSKGQRWFGLNILTLLCVLCSVEWMHQQWCSICHGHQTCGCLWRMREWRLMWVIVEVLCFFLNWSNLLYYCWMLNISKEMLNISKEGSCIRVLNMDIWPIVLMNVYMENSVLLRKIH